MTQATETQSREASLRFVDQEPVDREAEIVLDGRPPSEIWADLGRQLLPAIRGGIDAIVDGHPRLSPAEAIAAELMDDEQDSDETVPSSRDGSREWVRYLHLGESLQSLRDLDAVVGGLHPERVPNAYDALLEAIDLVVDLPTRTMSSVGVDTDFEDVHRVLRLLSHADTGDVPVVARVTEEFRDQRADQRRQICGLVAHVARGVPVEITTPTRLLQRWFAHAHEADLPGSLREQCNTGLQGASPETGSIEAALDTLAVDGGVVETLRDVAAAATESRTLDKLAALADVERNTIHQRLHRLRQFDLVSDAMETEDGSAVSLTSTGRAYLDAVYEFSGVQMTFEESLSASGKSSDNMPCNPAHAREGGAGGWSRNRLPALHEIREVDRSRYVAATSTTPNGAVSVVDTAVDTLDDRAAPGIYYDHDARRLLVSAEFDNPMSYWVCVARALADERVWSWILDEDSLEEYGAEEFLAFFEEHREVLRGLRCLGHLPDRLDSVDDYREELLTARDDLLKLTKRLTHGDYEDRDLLRSTITSNAHGLAGTMAHLLDLVDVDIVREVRIPRYREFTNKQQAGMVKTLSIGAAIQSAYGNATGYRQLFEQRSDKRDSAIQPTVDAGDPFGDLIGSFAIVGDFGDQEDAFVDSLSTALRSPTEVHEDAPEFAVRVPIINDHRRDSYATTVTRMCRAKGLQPTPEAVSVLSGIANSPYEVAAALERLDIGNDDRQIRSSELRFALSHLDVDEILRGTSSTPRKAVQALLCSDEPLSQTELADEAGVSARSLRTHLPDLIEIGLVEETPSGYRFQLAFDDEDGGYADIYPAYVVDEKSNKTHLAAKAVRVGRNHLEHGVPDDEFPRMGGEPMCRDLRGLLEADIWIKRILPLLWGLEIRGSYRDDPELGFGVGTRHVQMGPQIEQLSLQASTSEVAG